jgi:hypothetical protein
LGRVRPITLRSTVAVAPVSNPTAATSRTIRAALARRASDKSAQHKSPAAATTQPSPNRLTKWAKLLKKGLECTSTAWATGASSKTAVPMSSKLPNPQSQIRLKRPAGKINVGGLFFIPGLRIVKY